MTSLARAIEDGRSGVHRVAPGALGELERLAGAASRALHRVDVSGTPAKAAILRAFAQELRFPDWFGDNWDALQDALCDLSWLPDDRGIVLRVDGTDAVRATAPNELATLVEVLRSAARYWEAEERPFLVLLTGRGAAGIPALR